MDKYKCMELASMVSQLDWVIFNRIELDLLRSTFEVKYFHVMV